VVDTVVAGGRPTHDVAGRTVRPRPPRTSHLEGDVIVRNRLIAALVIGSISLLAGCSSTPGSSLTGKTWYLTNGSEQNPAWQWVVPVSQQSLFTITFNADGTISAKADCNQVTGTYTTSGSNGLTIEPGAMTMAYCGAQSLDTLYVQALGKTETFAVANDQLTLTLDDGGTLTFTSVAPTATPEPAASPADVPAGAPSDQALTGKKWQLTGATLRVPEFQGQVADADLSKYTITFADDGTFGAEVDCNQLAGTYETKDPAASSGPLTIAPGPMTLAACPEGSLGDLYVVGLSSAASYAIEADTLTITLVTEGTLEFK
jgi:heat shock protein HslJ